MSYKLRRLASKVAFKAVAENEHEKAMLYLALARMLYLLYEIEKLLMEIEKRKEALARKPYHLYV